MLTNTFEIHLYNVFHEYSDFVNRYSLIVTMGLAFQNKMGQEDQISFQMSISLIHMAMGKIVPG